MAGGGNVGNLSSQCVFWLPIFAIGFKGRDCTASVEQVTWPLEE